MSDFDSDIYSQQVCGQTLGGQINTAAAQASIGFQPQQQAVNSVHKTRTLDELEKRLEGSQQQAEAALETLRAGLKRLNGSTGMLHGLSAHFGEDVAQAMPEALIERLHLTLDRLDDLLRRCQTAAETLANV